MKDEKNLANLVDSTEVEVAETEEKESKVKNFIEKYGKKAVTIAAIGTVGLIGYAFGRKSKDDAVSTDEVLTDNDYVSFNDENDEE